MFSGLNDSLRAPLNRFGGAGGDRISAVAPVIVISNGGDADYEHPRHVVLDRCVNIEQGGPFGPARIVAMINSCSQLVRRALAIIAVSEVLVSRVKDLES